MAFAETRGCNWGAATLLEGAVAVISGGASDIGQAIARQLGAAGAQVIMGEIDPEAHVDALPDLTDVRRLDVRDSRSVRSIMEEVHKDYGRLDIVISNAAVSGAAALAPFHDQSEELIRNVFDTNLIGPFYVMQHASRVMIRDKRPGRMINIASISGLKTEMFAAAYAASKAGLIGLTRSAALELAAYSITVNCVAPGKIATQTSEFAESRRGVLSSARPRVDPLLGPAGTPEDVAAVVEFLASPGGRWITGATIVIDGGQLLA